MKIGQIGALAAAAGVAVETVRYYEKIGLLPAPMRAANGYRQYDDGHLATLAWIRHCRTLDLSLAEIAQLQQAMRSTGADCACVAAVIEQHLAALAEQIAALSAVQARLIALRGQCTASKTVSECGILQALNVVCEEKI